MRADAVAYRHDVFRDLEGEEASGCVDSFAQEMRRMRNQLARADELRYAYEKQRWFLDAVGAYCEAVARFASDLERVDVRSRGLLAFRDHLTDYVRSNEFGSLAAETRELREQLSSVRYSVRIRGPKVTVRRYEGEADYSRDVEETFERFRQGAVEDYRVRLPSLLEMNHVEASVLQGVAQLHPECSTRSRAIASGTATTTP